jgi:hypothetical protein
MIGLFLAYGAGRAAGRARRRREILPDGYAEFETAVLLTAAGIGLIWPIHLGYKLAQWGLRVGWAIPVAIIAGLLGLATGGGYLVIGFLYSGIWVAGLIVRGTREEDPG